MSKTKKLLEEKTLNILAEIAGIKKLNENEEEKSSIVVVRGTYDYVENDIMIHSLTDEGYNFLKEGGKHEKLVEGTHIRDSVSLEELVDTYNDVHGTEF